MREAMLVGDGAMDALERFVKLIATAQFLKRLQGPMGSINLVASKSGTKGTL